MYKLSSQNSKTAYYHTVISKFALSNTLLSTDQFTGANNPNISLVKKEREETCVINILKIVEVCAGLGMRVDGCQVK